MNVLGEVSKAMPWMFWNYTKLLIISL